MIFFFSLRVHMYLYRACTVPMYDVHVHVKFFAVYKLQYPQHATFALTRQTQFVHALLSPFLDFLAVSRPFPKQLADGALQCLKLGQ